MWKLLCSSLAVLLFTAPCALAAGQKRIIDVSAKGTRVHRAAANAPLTAPSRASRTEIVRAFLSDRGRGPAAQALHAVAENPHGAVTHVRFEQRVAGLPVYGTYVKATVDDLGRVRSVIENIVAPGPIAPARIGGDEAIRRAIDFHYPGRDLPASGPFWFQTPSASRVAIPLADGSLAEGHLVQTWDNESNKLWHTVVDGDGAVAWTQLRTAYDTYKIFPIHPGATPQTVVSGPGAGNTESPNGWVWKNTTSGNNVDAYLDRDANDVPDTGSRPLSQSTKVPTFEYTADLSQEPTVSINQRAAVTNLFYFNNVIHDRLYRHGFREAAGNFQNYNFGRGGLGGDQVLAEAQDGTGYNNASFATPPDGTKPRMQMFLWSSSMPSRDGDFDSDIIWHEYGHGLTERMIGDMDGPLAGAIGEGMSDALAVYINRNEVVGEYSSTETGGIRRWPYNSYYPLTYGSVTGERVHWDGEIYAATMAYLLELWEAAGYTLDELMNYVVDGMNYTPSRPSYEHMREGILAAVPTQPQDCIVWTAFAKFGIGVGAEGHADCYWWGSCGKPKVVESFAKPATCP
jgi:extracellular elastinolytic metalloproteinase